MYNLWLEYCNEGEASKSTQSRVVFYATKPSLARDEVLDRGANTSTERYTVHRPLLEQISHTVNELQVFIQHMASLIEERHTYFQVDPDDTLLKVLGGAETTSQLHAAWLGLTSRLSAAQKFMLKYQQEYQDAPVPTSPVSTNPDIHKYITSLLDIDDRLRSIHGMIPRHADKLSRNARQRLTENKEKWESIIPVPPWLETPTQKSSSPISDVSARTSYKAASSFTLPERAEPSALSQKKQSTPLWKGPKAVQFAPQTDETEPTPSPALMSSGTPFKPSKSLFAQEDGNTLGPFPQATPNRPISANNFLYGTDEVPAFSHDGMQFSGFSYPSNTNITPLIPSTRPITSTPWNQGAGRVQSFHSLISQNPERTTVVQNHGSQARTQTMTTRITTEGTNNTQHVERPEQSQNTTNPTNHHSVNSRHSGNPGGGGSDPPDDNDPPRNPVNNNASSNDERRLNHRRSGSRRGRRGGPPDPPSSSSSSSRTRSSNSSRSDWEENRPPAPYGNYIPTVKTDIKLEQLPTWDGNHNTAIDYFWKIQQLAAMKGYLPQALGYWLWMNLKEESTVRMWFAMCSHEQQEYMRSHYVAYMRGIKEGFLGRTWQMRMNAAYKNQSFRQLGHEREDPGKFIIRRIMYTRMLVNGDMGGPLEVFLVMQRAPISWGPVINIDSIRSSSMLFSKVTEHSQALIHASKMESSQIVTADNLMYTLRRLGISLPSERSTPAPAKFIKRAHLTEATPNTVDDPPTPSSIPSPIDEGILKEVYQVLQRKQRPPPPGGYPFKRNDHVSTKMGRLPPSPCKVCGSPNHWDKECPDWNVYLETRNRSAHFSVGVSDVETDLEEKYCAAYVVLLNNKVAEQLLDLNEPSPFTDDQDFHEAVVMSLVRQSNHHSHGHKTCGNKVVSVEEILDEETEAARLKPTLGKVAHILEHVSEQSTLPPAANQPSPRPSVIDVEDEDDIAAHSRPKAVDPRNILESTDDSKGAEPPPTPHAPSQNSRFVYSVHGIDIEGQLQEETPNPNRDFTLPFLDLPGPPAPLSRVRMPKARITKPGASAVGVSVLSAKGRLVSAHNPEIDLRLDSCADITLISEELYLSLRDRPPLQQGYQMQIFQLTDTGTHIKGFTRIPVLMESTDGTIVETEAEAYVVPNMTVPILLGEDYHLTYEIAVSRSVTEGSYLHFKGTPYSVPAIGVDRTNDFDRLRKGAHHTSSFVKAKTHKRAKAKRQRKKRQAREDAHLIKAAQDYRIRPHESCRVDVVGYFEDEREWFVEKNMLSCGNDNVLIVPNVLISSRNPQVPVANSSQPRFIRKGEVLATIVDPAQYFDIPRDADQWHEMSRKAEALSAIITATSEGVDTEPEEYGPKTAAMPDPTIYPSSQMKDLLDVGSLPEHLQDEAWRMLSSHEKAFGFDGRLGHYPSKVHIRTVDGQVPISVPMYGSSPAKRQVIDEQIDKWFEQGVIEPSKSPWSAPVVIAYRHGKARFCVDYRKLNAATIPDEFPIPRQSEILASLSGAQVLSSLDALSGFTQLEMAEEDVEKTAFRTHRGLFQFRRLPFGLRNGPSIFQRVMQNILAPYLWIFCLVYIDDIVIYSKSYEEHIVHLDKVLGAIERSGITLSPAKCHMFYDSILLLGHRVSRLGLSTHLEKVRAITDLQRPGKVSELQTFLSGGHHLNDK